MRKGRKWLRRTALALALLLVAGLAARQWLVTPLIVSLIEKRYSGRVTVQSWWLNASSSGLIGIKLREDHAKSSPVWASVERIKTDVSLERLIHGKVAPRLISISAPSVALHLNEKGALLTNIRFRSGTQSAKIPEVVVDQGKLHLVEDGRPPLDVVGIHAQLLPTTDATIAISARADDPNWGATTLAGKCDSSLAKGRIRLRSDGLPADARKSHSIPFVPPIVWKSIAPEGLVNVELDLTWKATPKIIPETTPRTPKSRPTPPTIEVAVRTEFVGTHLDVPILQFSADHVRGVLFYQDQIVRLEGVHGSAFGGSLATQGTMDFTTPDSKYDLDIGIAGASLPKLPKWWHIQSIGLQGHLDGKADLKLVLSSGLIDLSGTSCQGVIEDGSCQGIPVAKISFAATTTGRRHDQKRSSLADVNKTVPIPKTPDSTPLVPEAKISAVAPADVTKNPMSPPSATKLYFQIPESIASKLKLGRANLRLAVDPSMAKIPTPSGHDWTSLIFDGSLAIDQAEYEDIRIGDLIADFSYDRGVAESAHFGARVLDPPGGKAGIDRPMERGEIQSQGKLPAGAFRGAVRANFKPDGLIAVRLETNQVPIEVLVRHLDPHPLPLSGRITLSAKGQAPYAEMHDPSNWTLAGTAQSARLVYRNTELTNLTTQFALKDKHVFVNNITAYLNNEPLVGVFDVGLAPPYAFHAKIDSRDWRIADLRQLSDQAGPRDVEGILSIHGTATGTIQPLDVKTDGNGRIKRLEVSSEALGDLAFHWKTQDNAILFSANETKAFGGSLQAELRIPTHQNEANPPAIPDPITGNIKISALDLTNIPRRLVGEHVKLKGKATGQLHFQAENVTDLSSATGHANATLSGPDLRIDKVDVNAIHLDLALEKRIVSYVIKAESLGGDVDIRGNYPIADRQRKKPAVLANALIKARNLSLGQLARDLNPSGVVSRFAGIGDLDLSLKAPTDNLAAMGADGQIRLRDLQIGSRFYLGDIMTDLKYHRGGWTLGSLHGNLLGGEVTGSIVAESSKTDSSRSPIRFDAMLAEVNLKRAAAAEPAIASLLQGLGEVRIVGQYDHALDATAEVLIAKAKVAGLPLLGFHAAAGVEYSPIAHSGSIHVNRFTTKLAGGQVNGHAIFRLGDNKSFQANLQLNQLDLETLTHSHTEEGKPAKGKIQGHINLEGPSPTRLDKLRGKIVLDLDDGSLFSLPVLSQISKFLGLSRSGVFEDGDLSATISNNRMSVDELTLVGRLMQLHARGTVEFDGRINLKVVLNTNELIALPAQVLRAIVPLRRGSGGSPLSSQLIKLRISGTIHSPVVSPDPTIELDDDTTNFFIKSLGNR